MRLSIVDVKRYDVWALARGSSVVVPKREQCDQRPSIIPGFGYSVERWLKRGGHRYGLGWRLELPVKGGSCQVDPLYLQDFNPNPANDYWEGLCRLLDEKGESMGYCVAETTGSAHGGDPRLPGEGPGLPVE